jgi:hypothetical protein
MWSETKDNGVLSLTIMTQPSRITAPFDKKSLSPAILKTGLISSCTSDRTPRLRIYGPGTVDECFSRKAGALPEPVVTPIMDYIRSHIHVEWTVKVIWLPLIL